MMTKNEQWWEYDARKHREHKWRTDPDGDPVGWLTFGGHTEVIYDATGLQIIDNIHTMFNGHYLPHYLVPPGRI